MIIKFTDHKYAQAHMEPIPGGIALYSYATRVAEVRDGWLHIFGLYSPTTRRHIGWFMRELGRFTYQLTPIPAIPSPTRLPHVYTNLPSAT